MARGGGDRVKSSSLGNPETRARGEGEGRARAKGEEARGLTKWVVFYDDVGFRTQCAQARRDRGRARRGRRRGGG